jgi:hypothetical protein
MNRSSAKWTKAQNCSDCELGVQKMQLSSPFGYDDEGAATFASLTSRCDAGNHSYATPAPYAINATAPEAPPARTCTGTYTVQEGDTCISISARTIVSTYGLITANGFDISCNLLSPVGSTICLPKACNTHRLTDYERCDGITTPPSASRVELHDQQFLQQSCQLVWVEYVHQVRTLSIPSSSKIDAQVLALPQFTRRSPPSRTK